MISVQNGNESISTEVPFLFPVFLPTVFNFIIQTINTLYFSHSVSEVAKEGCLEPKSRLGLMFHWYRNNS